ncbi:LLM class flavin-dependent oxidoreductase [Nonomuraea typhae]|uniref:LLM class flavin-dependent oxidoreductase n=1 Tax=Nonomuraea typhae TaxID=2603600 RepID=A0ABW7YVU8_9ACTN
MNLVAAACRAEQRGAGRVIVAEADRDPFLPLACVAARTSRLQVCTGIAVAFARTPMTLAYQGWGLQEASSGRAVIGVGTQIKAHIERRYGMPWSKPVPRIGEFLTAVRHIWHCWQRQRWAPFHGAFYQHTMMGPEFSPPPPTGPSWTITAGASSPTSSTGCPCANAGRR